MRDTFAVVIIGAGAAGLAALRRLSAAGVDAVALEARERIGGRAHTWLAAPELPLDCGCGWLHSADVSELTKLIEASGFEIDRTPPPWERQAFNLEMTPAEQAAFGRALAAFDEKVEACAKSGVDRPAAELLTPGDRWNPRLEAISSYYNGVEFDRLSVLDYAAFEDTDVNWRVAAGYGAAVAALGASDRIVLGCAATSIDHQGRDIVIETSKGAIRAGAVIVTIPTPHIAQGRFTFSPDLPEKRTAAEGLPLGLADKVFLSPAEPEALPADQNLAGKIDHVETGSYHLRPFGRPYIEAFLGGRLARTLEAEGPGAAAAFAREELGDLMGSDFRDGLRIIGETRWATDQWALGSYSHALPGCSGQREILAAPVGGRLFFAGEATSERLFSTAHGAWETGERAAEEALAVLSRSPPSG